MEEITNKERRLILTQDTSLEEDLLQASNLIVEILEILLRKRKHSNINPNNKEYSKWKKLVITKDD